MVAVDTEWSGEATFARREKQGAEEQCLPLTHEDGTHEQATEDAVAHPGQKPPGHTRTHRSAPGLFQDG